MSDSTELNVVIQELAAARQALADTVTKVRRRHRGFVFLSVVSTVFLIGYLGYAAARFGGEVTPELVAVNMQEAFRNALPATRVKLQQGLKDNAPKVVTGAFDQLEAMPAKYADSIQQEASARIDATLPQIREGIYTSMKQAVQATNLSLASAGGPAKDDEARLKASLAAVSDVYATETIKFVDQAHGTYAADALAFTDYLEHLATAPNLDRRDRLHRDMFQTIFALVRARAAAPDAAGADAVPTALPVPAGS